ncbi:NADPH-dependent FMN reductase [Paenibacillus senegalimassiliensis]|uniref:NADPH-dependent FMN reductase n=1 Tax=Paenibacillus senegalimassiliensis TaxID=1737426 RepID=UPI00073F9B44|nr:NADPH-dependent FMN reductase [Paenibacillus senegalimassiliensis]
MKKAIIIYGAPVKQSRVKGITDTLGEELKTAGFETEVLYPQDLPADKLLYADFANPEIQDAVRRVEQADVVVVATPIYKASFSGFVKVFLDMIPQKGLEGKVVLPVAVGGTLAHMLVLDYAIRPVVAALANSHTLQGVFALDQWIERREDGGYTLTPELEERVRAAVGQLALAAL